MAITRTDARARQNEHAAVIAHGAHPEYRLEFPAEVEGSDDNFTKIYQGSVVSLNSNGKYVCGCGAGTGVNYPVPCISLKNVFDPDVTTGKVADPVSVTVSSGTADEHTLTYYNPRKSTYSAVGGVITAIPCTGGYEIETTEFDKDATYAINDALIAGTSDTIGKVTVATSAGKVGTAPVLGFVSRKPFVMAAYGQDRVAFFTNFIPVTH